jgi:glyoxylase-like metal-dependent hydrolase (beta-lactamase superfamily II)
MPVFPPSQVWLTREVATDDRGRAIMDVIGMVIRTPESVIVVDPASWTRDELSQTLDVIAGRSIDDALATLGLVAEAVTHVAITHGHADHISGLVRTDAGGPEPRFPNALHLFPMADWDSLVLDDSVGVNEIVGGSLKPVERCGLLTLVDGEHQIDQFVTLLPAPGESDGHQIVRIADGGDRVFYLGDLFHFPVEVEHLDWGPEHADHVVLEATRRRVLAEAGGPDSTLVFSHGRFPGWGRAEYSGGVWRWHYVE